MKKEILPQGDFIRQLLTKSNVTCPNINQLLREKGVFIGHNEKNNSVPLLMKSIISPKDYNDLYNTQKVKEDTFKFRTSSINCNKDFDLLNLFEDIIDLNTLINDRHTYKPNYKVVGDPTFFLENDSTAVLEFQIQRENLLNDWTNNTTYHKGALTLSKQASGQIQISIQQSFTSKETSEVNTILHSVIKERLISKSLINPDDDFISIKFNHFDNSSRIKFFYSFTGDINIFLKFESITDIDLFLDETVESHRDIKIFLDEIDNLKLNGKELQNHKLLNNDIYFPKLIFGAIRLKYKLDYQGSLGNAVINLGFPEYTKSKEQNSELQISIDLSLNKQIKNSRAENNIRKKLLDLVEVKKIESYNKFKI